MKHGFNLGFFLAAPATKFCKSEISRALDRAFLGCLGVFFVATLPPKRMCFNTQEFTHFLSTGVDSASSYAFERVLSNKVI